MKVKEAISVLTEAKKLYLCWNDNLRIFDPTDALMMDAYGDYKVKRICNAGESAEEYEIAIAAAPIKEADK